MLTGEAMLAAATRLDGTEVGLRFSAEQYLQTAMKPFVDVGCKGVLNKLDPEHTK